MDPKELQKQLDDLNDEFDQLNRSITSVASSLGNMGKTLTSTVIDAQNLTEQLGKGKNVTKEVEAQLLKNKKALEANFIAEIQQRAAGNKQAVNSLIVQRQLLYNLDSQLRTLKKINEEYQKNNNALGYLNDKLKNLNKSFKEFFSIGAIFKMIIDSGLRFNKVSVDIGKNLGYGADNANRYTKELVAAAQSSGNLNFTLQNAADATNELNAATGYVAEYSASALETQIMLTKQFKLTGEEASGIYKLSVLTGKSSEKVNDEMVGAFAATRNNLRAGVPFKSTMAEAARVSGILASNLQNNPKRIIEAVTQAKALGTSLEQSAKQGEALLNFESSLENELKAELLTGKQLNLERARAAALVGDQVTLTEELAKNVGTIEEFDRMNVLQKKAIAEAVGLTADELAKQLQNQKIALDSGKSLAQVNKEQLLEAQKRQDIQDKFNTAILKLQDLIGNLVVGPMGAFIDGLSKGLDIIGKIFGFVGKISEGFKNLLGSKVSSVIGGAASLATIGALIALVGRSLLKGTVPNPMITRDISMATSGKGSGGGFFGGGGKGGGKYRDPKTGRYAKAPKGGGFKGGGGLGLGALVGGLGLGYASEMAAESGKEDLSKGLGIAGGALSGAGTGAMIGSIIPVIGTGIGAVAGGLIGGIGYALADDMIGYGARTLITPTGNVALNNQDTVIAGTNLFRGDDVLSMPKGALSMGGADFTPMIAAINEVKIAVNQLMNRPVIITIDSKQVGSSLVQASPKSA